MINPASISLESLPSVPLEDRQSLPCEPCIYFAIDGQGVVQYIGRSVNPARRWASHHKRRSLESIGGVRIAYLALDADLLADVEAALIEWFNPPLNCSIGGYFPPHTHNQGTAIKSNLPVLMARHNPPLSQSAVAAAAGVSPTTINHLYNDKLQRLDRSLAQRLYEAYGWTPGDIWIVEASDFDRAVDAYADYCERIGAVFQQPSQTDSEEKRGIIYLRNANGLLARYSVRQGKILGDASTP
jgi:hypothetical protein